MPNRNGTGPEGLGPRTGWGMGNCAGGPAYGYGRGGGRGRGRGFGPGRGRGRGWFGSGSYSPRPLTVEEEKAELQAQAEDLRQELDYIEKRLKGADKQS